MPNARPRAVARRGDGIAGHASVAHFGQPQVAFDSGTANETSHEIYGAILGGGCVDGSAVTGKGIACGEVQTSRRPRIGRVWGVAHAPRGLQGELVEAPATVE